MCDRCAENNRMLMSTTRYTISITFCTDKNVQQNKNISSLYIYKWNVYLYNEICIWTLLITVIISNSLKIATESPLAFSEFGWHFHRKGSRRRKNQQQQQRQQQQQQRNVVDVTEEYEKIEWKRKEKNGKKISKANILAVVQSDTQFWVIVKIELFIQLMIYIYSHRFTHIYIHFGNAISIPFCQSPLAVFCEWNRNHSQSKSPWQSNMRSQIIPRRWK